MATAAPADLDRIRTKADRFIAELDEEYYLHFAGLKESFDLEPIYERYADLTELETAQTVGAAVDGDRQTRELWRFTIEGYLGRLTRAHEERHAHLEVEMKAEVDGEQIPFRMLRPTIANEPDRDRRRRLDAVRCELTEERLNPIHLESVQVVREAVRKLGSDTYADLYRRFGYDLDGLAGQCRAILDSTEQLYE